MNKHFKEFLLLLFCGKLKTNIKSNIFSIQVDELKKCSFLRVLENSDNEIVIVGRKPFDRIIPFSSYTNFVARFSLATQDKVLLNISYGKYFRALILLIRIMVIISIPLIILGFSQGKATGPLGLVGSLFYVISFSLGALLFYFSIFYSTILYVKKGLRKQYGVYFKMEG